MYKSVIVSVFFLAAANFSPIGADPAEAGEAARRCMAITLYWEAKTFGRDGMVAVGSVVLNRVADPAFPDSVCEVVRDGGETPPCQFAYWCDGRGDKPPGDDPDWALARELAAAMLTERPEDPTGSALFFHAADIEPPWEKPRQRTGLVAGHVFYR